MSLRSTIAGRLREERGMALVMAIGISFVLAILGASVILFTTSNERHSKRQNATVTLYEREAIAARDQSVERGHVVGHRPVGRRHDRRRPRHHMVG